MRQLETFGGLLSLSLSFCKRITARHVQRIGRVRPGLPTFRRENVYDANAYPSWDCPKRHVGTNIYTEQESAKQAKQEVQRVA
jgi:hypothetical protein